LRYLPIIYNIRKVKITESYHNIWGLTRIGDNMAISLIAGEMLHLQYVGRTSKKGRAISDPAL
jgi:hypothetical protein